MKIAFFSNFLNHHQLPFCQEMVKRLGDGFTFVACEPIHQERLNMGYQDVNRAYPFVLRTYDSPEAAAQAMELAVKADVMIIGSAPNMYCDVRMAQNKLTFRYAERLFKKGTWRRFIPTTYKKVYDGFLKHKKKDRFFTLCASAYTAYDLSLCGFPVQKCLKWGYFPEVVPYDIEALLSGKQEKTSTILWVGRFLDWKRTCDALTIVKMLKRDGYSFCLDVIGSGPCEKALKEQCKRDGLNDCVRFLGSMPPAEVRRHMEHANIYLFTSNFYEGWGAVLNESMNSGCAVVASHAIGSAPYLIQDEMNGLLYEYGKIDDFYKKVKRLFDDPALQMRLGRGAYETMYRTWNAELAVEAFLKLVLSIENGRLEYAPYGPCSSAEVLKNG